MISPSAGGSQTVAGSVTLASHPLARSAAAAASAASDSAFPPTDADSASMFCLTANAVFTANSEASLVLTQSSSCSARPRGAAASRPRPRSSSAPSSVASRRCNASSSSSARQLASEALSSATVRSNAAAPAAALSLSRTAVPVPLAARVGESRAIRSAGDKAAIRSSVVESRSRSVARGRSVLRHTCHYPHPTQLHLALPHPRCCRERELFDGRQPATCVVLQRLPAGCSQRVPLLVSSNKVLKSPSKHMKAHESP